MDFKQRSNAIEVAEGGHGQQRMVGLVPVSGPFQALLDAHPGSGLGTP